MPRYADAAPQGLLAAQVLATGDSPVATPYLGAPPSGANCLRRCCPWTMGAIIAAGPAAAHRRRAVESARLDSRAADALSDPATNRTAGLMVNVDQIGRAPGAMPTSTPGSGGCWTGSQPGLTSSLPPLDQQPGYLWLCYLHRAGCPGNDVTTAFCTRC